MIYAIRNLDNNYKSFGMEPEISIKNQERMEKIGRERLMGRAREMASALKSIKGVTSAVLKDKAPVGDNTSRIAGMARVKVEFKVDKTLAKYIGNNTGELEVRGRDAPVEAKELVNTVNSKLKRHDFVRIEAGGICCFMVSDPI